jgi:hypothetical protein
MALSGVDSGHHNHQTSGNLTSSCEDFLNKESTTITQEVWRNLNIKMSKTLHALNNKLLKNLQKKNTARMENACLQKNGGVNFQLLP